MAETGPSRRGLRFLNVALAVLGFALVCAALNAILPFPEIGVVASHLRYFKKHGNEFDTLFLGSSQTHHNISPAVFDRVMRERGHPTRSFNFGVDGMLLAESSYVLDRILATKPTGLKWIFIEFDELETRPFAGAEGSRRDVYWRDWKRTSLLLRKLFQRSQDESLAYANETAVMPQLEKTRTGLRELLQFHLTLFGKNIANVSRTSDLSWWLAHFWRPSKMPEDLGPDGDGFLPMDQELPEERKKLYQWRLEKERAGKGPRFISPATERAYRQITREVRGIGATPVFIGMPTLLQAQLEFRSGVMIAPILSFNDADRYPQIYRADLRADEIHLNRRGTAAFSDLLAQEFCALLEKRPSR